MVAKHLLQGVNPAPNKMTIPTDTQCNVISKHYIYVLSVGRICKFKCNPYINIGKVENHDAHQQTKTVFKGLSPSS